MSNLKLRPKLAHLKWRIFGEIRR